MHETEVESALKESECLSVKHKLSCNNVHVETIAVFFVVFIHIYILYSCLYFLNINDRE